MDLQFNVESELRDTSAATVTGRFGRGESHDMQVHKQEDLGEDNIVLGAQLGQNQLLASASPRSSSSSRSQQERSLKKSWKTKQRPEMAQSVDRNTLNISAGAAADKFKTLSRITTEGVLLKFV